MSRERKCSNIAMMMTMMTLMFFIEIIVLVVTEFKRDTVLYIGKCIFFGFSGLGRLIGEVERDGMMNYPYKSFRISDKMWSFKYHLLLH